jgi:hypothetical protein
MIKLKDILNKLMEDKTVQSFGSKNSWSNFGGSGFKKGKDWKYGPKGKETKIGSDRGEEEKANSDETGYKSLHEATTLGDCYQAGGKLIYEFFGDNKAKLVHGMVDGQGPLTGIRFGHCWVESGNKVFDHSNGGKKEVSKQLYYKVGNINPKDCKYYTAEQAVKFMVSKKHWGPWEMSGDTIKLVNEDIPDKMGEIGKKRIRISPELLRRMDNE